MSLTGLYHFLTDKNFVDMLMLLGGGIGIFLLGIRMMSDGFQTVAGARLNRWMGAITDNRLLAVCTGIGVTGIIQSSTATIVTVVGLVNGGVMTLTQAIGVIFGANIGTTLTAWFMTLNLSKYGLLIVGISAIPFLFSKKEKVKHIALIWLGLGLLFSGLGFMSTGVKPLKESADVMAWFATFRATGYLSVLGCVLAGTVFTTIVQSSTAAIGIVITLAMQGMIDFPTALALLLGDNIGTSVSTFIMSLGTSRNARRAAFAHLMFNLIGAVWAFALYKILFAGVEKMTVAAVGAFHFPLDREAAAELAEKGFFPYPALGIALAHTVYNITNTLLFLPFLGWFAALIRWLVPESKAERMAEIAQRRIGFLDRNLLKTPAVAIEQSRKKIVAMGDLNLRMFRRLKHMLLTDEPYEEHFKFILDGEKVLDEAQREIMDFVSQLAVGKGSQTLASEARRQIRQADELESVSDYIMRLAKSRNRVLQMHDTFTDEAKAELAKLHAQGLEYAELVVKMLREKDSSLVAQCRALDKEMLQTCKQSYAQLLQRLTDEQVSAAKSVVYSDVLVEFRGLRDHLQNVVDTMSDVVHAKPVPAIPAPDLPDAAETLDPR